MRFASLSLATAFSLLTLGVLPSDAQYFSMNRYCTFGGNDNTSGEPDCSYWTWEQCRASASGLSRYCGENPFYVAPPRAAGAREMSAKHKGKSKRNN
jgi:hypothetical protein